MKPSPRVRMMAWMAAFALAAAHAVVFEEVELDTPAQERTYRALIAELRCLVCQNQSLAESDAPLAADLRQQVREMLRAGDDRTQIIEYMVARYGDFVLYRPPLRWTTLALWAGPFVLGFLGLWWLLRQVRSQARAPAAAPLSAEERARLAAALDGSERDRAGS
jgi:cytochrome c-type biogenesis protein CcmH